MDKGSFMQSMPIATIVVASAMLASCSDKTPKRVPDPAVEVSGIPVHLGDSRQVVLKRMGMPNSILDNIGRAEIQGGEMATILAPDGNKMYEHDLSKDPQLLTSRYWKYYGYKSNHNNASVHFDGNTVVAVRYEKTNRPMRTPYD